MRIVLIFAAFCALLSGCEPTCASASDPRIVWFENFENLCNGNPCGWTASGSGTASTDSSLHAGSHELSLSGNVTAKYTANYRRENSGLSFPLVLSPIFTFSPAAGSEVVEEAIAVTVTGVDLDTNEVRTFSSTFNYTASFTTTYTEPFSLSEVHGSSVFSNQGFVVTSIVLQKTGAGTVKIDDLQFADSSYLLSNSGCH